MFKRVTWMGVGMVVGAAGAFRAKRKAEEVVERYLPEQVVDRAAGSARLVGQTVKAAAVEGREAMRATEAELRSRVEARTFVGEGISDRERVHDQYEAGQQAKGPRRQPRSSRGGVPTVPARRRSRR